MVTRNLRERVCVHLMGFWVCNLMVRWVVTVMWVRWRGEGEEAFENRKRRKGGGGEGRERWMIWGEGGGRC